MSSRIDTSIPRAGHADTARLRAQFDVIKAEIETLQSTADALEAVLDDGIPLPDNVLTDDDVSAVARSGSYYHLRHRPFIPRNAEDLGALPVTGGEMEGDLTLYADGRRALSPTTLQQLNSRIAALRQTLAVVATSGRYSDLIDRPELGTAASRDADAFATAAQGGKADSATQPGDLHAVATSGQYADLTGTPGNATEALAGLMAAADKARLNGIEADATADQTAAEILAALLTVDGAGSGLNADKLDGKQLAALESDYRGYADQVAADLVDSSPETLDTLNELAAALGNDPNFATTVSQQIGKKLDADAYTAADVLAKLATVTGPGSGLDADTLDGQHADAFATAAQGGKADSATQPGDLHAVATSGKYADLKGTPSNATEALAGLMAAADKIKLNGIEADATADQTAAEILAALLTVDGAGSGLNADKLDGKDAGAFALAGHAHDYLPLNGKADDADKLDGKHADDFATAAQGGKADSALQPKDAYSKTQADSRFAQLEAQQVLFEYSGDGGLIARTKNNSGAFIFQAKSSGGAPRFTVKHGAVEMVGDSDGWRVGSNTVWHAGNFDPSAFAAASVLPPVNAAPAAGSEGTPADDVTLEASAFASVGNGDRMASAQWQISTDPDFTSIVYDSGEVTA